MICCGLGLNPWLEFLRPDCRCRRILRYSIKEQIINTFFTPHYCIKVLSRFTYFTLRPINWSVFAIDTIERLFEDALYKYDTFAPWPTVYLCICLYGVFIVWFDSRDYQNKVVWGFFRAGQRYSWALILLCRLVVFCVYYIHRSKQMFWAWHNSEFHSAIALKTDVVG